MYKGTLVRTTTQVVEQNRDEKIVTRRLLLVVVRFLVVEVRSRRWNRRLDGTFPRLARRTNQVAILSIQKMKSRNYHDLKGDPEQKHC